jgi:hypothetical protein
VPPPVYYQPQDPSVAEALNKRNNWRLLTPEQIMGVQTAEEIMGVADRGTEPKRSLEEKFLLRQLPGSRGGATNSRSGALTREDRNPFEQNRDGQFPFKQKAASQMDDVTPKNSTWSWGQPKPKPDENFPGETDGGPANNTIWKSAFAQPERAVPFGQSPEEMAKMERFRALMNPPAPSAPAPTRVSPAPVSAPAFFEASQPTFNPAGRSAVTVQANIAKPTGIKPLPAATGSTLAPQTKKPEWQAQPPPWMTDKPQPQTRVRNYGK